MSAKQMAKPQVVNSALASEMGRTDIDAGVVAKIASLAVREVEGVHHVAPFGASQALEKMASSLTGDELRSLGVKVEVGAVETAVDVRIVVNYGTSIPKLADALRKNVAERLDRMTGLACKEINIEVVDLWFAEDDKPKAVEAPRVR